MQNPLFRIELAGGAHYINLLQITRVEVVNNQVTIYMSDDYRFTVSAMTWQAIKARFEEWGQVGEA